VTLRELFLLPSLKHIKGDISGVKKIFAKKFPIAPLDEEMSTIVLPYSYPNTSNINQFISAANIAPDPDGNVQKLIPVSNECFDHGWLFSSAFSYDPYPVRKFPNCYPFALFIDSKSGRQFPDNVNAEDIKSFVADANTKVGSFQLTDLPGKGKQAEHMQKIVKEAKNWPAENVVKGSLLEALRNDCYVYVYLNTAKSAQSFAVDKNTIQLGEADSKRFLSFLRDGYKLARAASSKAQKLDEEDRLKSGGAF
jgi:hypothetical protein